MLMYKQGVETKERPMGAGQVNIEEAKPDRKRGKQTKQQQQQQQQRLNR